MTLLIILITCAALSLVLALLYTKFTKDAFKAYLNVYWKEGISLAIMQEAEKIWERRKQKRNLCYGVFVGYVLLILTYFLR